MANQPKRVGLIGLSAGGSWATVSHLPYLTSSPLYTITALQNSSKASAEAAAEKHDLKNVATYDDPKSLAADPRVDIVAVSVKVPLHYELVKPALEAGKDVFVEWPLARTLSDAIEFAELAKKNSVRTLVGLQARQNPSIIKAKEIVTSGKLGKILSTTVYAHAMGFGDTMTADTAYALDINNGVTSISVPLGHTIDALCYVLGELDSLSATLAVRQPDVSILDKDGKELEKGTKTTHDHVDISGTLVDGGAVVHVTYAGGVSRTGRNFWWEIIGTEGTLLLECSHGLIQMFQPTLKFFTGEGEGMQVGGRYGKGVKVESIEVEKAGQMEKGDFSFNVGKEWDAWAGIDLEKGFSPVSFEDAVVRHKMIEAIYRSAKDGTRVRYL